jgi:LPS-assembly protein
MAPDTPPTRFGPPRFALWLAAACLGLSMHGAAQDTAVEPGAPQDTQHRKTKYDWVSIEDVPVEERDRACRQCRGRYEDPLASEDTSTEPEESEIRARADSGQLEGDEVILLGGARAVQGYRRMSGDQVTIDRERNSATISGNVTLREPGVLLTGDRAEIFSESGKATVQEGHYVFHDRHMRGSADLLERDEIGIVHIHEGKFTYCAPGENQWVVRAEKMDLDFEEGLGTARDATVEIKDVPVFYTPWLSFPLDDRRRTGFLWPDFGNDSTGGLDVTVPYYFNLAPNYDALYSPRYIEERGLNHGLVLRYLNPLIGHWSFGGAYMSSDDKYEDDVSDDRSTDRWLAQVQQNGLFQQRWRSRIDYSKASDIDYLKDLETTSLESQRETSLLQLGSLDYLGDDWLLGLDVQQFQSLADDIQEDYKKLPQFTASYRNSGTPFQLEPVVVAQYSNFDSDEERVTGQRMYGEAGLRYPMLWPYGFVTPTVKYRQLYYELSDTQDSVFFEDDSPSTGTALASLDSGLYFDRFTSFNGKSFLQTLEPRLYYLYSGYEEQSGQPDFDSAELTFTYNQLFRETRFSGRDRLDDANQVSMGLTTRFIDEETGRSLLDASIGQIYYLRDRKVRLNPLDEPLDDSGSEIAGELGFAPSEQLGARASLVYDPFDDRMNSANFFTSYETHKGALFNVGYSYRRFRSTQRALPSTEEAHISTYLPLTRNWSLFGALNYSLEADESVEDMFGVEYDSCCWTFRLLHLRYYNNVSGTVPDFNDPDLERENTTQFQIILKGMGGYGDEITNIMEDMIRGFDERDY